MIELAQQGYSKRTPYTTKSGLQIGLHYEPPRSSQMSQEDEHWQCVLLGLKPNPSAIQIIVFGAYCAFLVVVFAVVALMVKP